MDSHKIADCLRAGLHPDGIAVVGASERNFYGRNALENIQRGGYGGRLVAINPREESVLGVPAYPSLAEAPDVDLVVVAIGRNHFASVIQDVVSSGAKVVVALTSGLSETGDPVWTKVEEDARRVLENAGAVLVGPNGLGLISFVSGAFAWGAPVPWQIDVGRTALVMQSGGLLCGALAAASAQGLGLAHVASIGNGRSVGVADWVGALADAQEVDHMGLMLEAMPPWPAFSSAVRQARAQGKTVYALKTGKSEKGARAAATHTGALAGSYATSADLLTQLGVLECGSMGGLVTALTLHERFGAPQAGNLAVLTASGGASGIVADACDVRGIGLREFGDDTRAAINGQVGILDPSNPLDLGGQALSMPEEFGAAVRRVLEDEGVGAALYIPTLGLPDDSLPHHQRLLAEVAAAAAAAGKPVVVSQLTQPSCTSLVQAQHRSTPHLLVSPTVEHALDGLGPWLAGAPRGLDSPVDRSAVETAPDADATGHDDLASALGPDEPALKRLLASRGLRVPRSVLLEPGRAPDPMPFERAVLKGVSPGVLHKSRLGLVELALEDAAAVSDAGLRMVERARAAGVTLPQLLLEEMAAPGPDLFVSLSAQPMGMVVTVGEGGTDVEERGVVGFVGWPATREELDAAVRRVLPQLDTGVRSDLCDVIGVLAEICEEEGWDVLECNPVRAVGDELVLLDAVAHQRGSGA
jgi:acyl-CoA synthetase (NDP forming)